MHCNHKTSDNQSPFSVLMDTRMKKPRASSIKGLRRLLLSLMIYHP